MLLADGIFLLYSIYVPIIIALYILEMVVIFRQRKLPNTGSFHRIFTVLATVNIVACLLGSFVFRLNLYPIVNGFYRGFLARSWCISAVYAAAYYSNSLSEMLGVLQALNRFTALFFTLRHEQLWRWAFPIGVLLCALVSVAPVGELLNDTGMFVEAGNDTGYRWFYLKDVSSASEGSIWMKMLIVSVVSNAISSLLYTACLIRLYKFSITRSSAMERNFFLVGFFCMICSLPYMCAMLYFYLYQTTGKISPYTVMFVTFQVPWLTDLKFLTPAPMLLITNRNMRDSIKSILGKGLAKVSSVSY